MIIITGASRGVGNYLLNSYLHKSDEQVIGTYFNSKPTENLDVFEKIDVNNMDEIKDFVQRKESSLVDITLINCAGISYNSFAHKSDPTNWKGVVETNLFGTYNFIRSLLPLMREQKFGRIVNFSSVVAIKPTPGVSAYAASKSALWGLSKSIAFENAIFNISVNTINLGYSELGMIETVPEEFRKHIVSQIPAGILCEPKDILSTVNYLRSTRYITGATIDLTGGLI
jgi:NAD(P)-dependent dehydrogenase (short-subunit alcohol dehydrogenase family)